VLFNTANDPPPASARVRNSRLFVTMMDPFRYSFVNTPLSRARPANDPLEDR
jgi:hypothetical protein